MHGGAGQPGRQWSNRDVLREMDRHRSRWTWGLLLGMALSLAPVGVYIHQQNLCLKLAYEIQGSRVEQARLQEQQRRLRARRARLESLSSIEAWGASHGLVRPGPEHVVVVRRVVPGPSDLLALELSADGVRGARASETGRP